MNAFRRPRVFIPALVVLVLVVGVLAIRSRSNYYDNDSVVTEKRTQNCDPIARADAAATRPGEPVLVDVLANDTDPDGDGLVFEILKTDGGVSEIDDGGTPTDSSDDRLSFTPADPPVDTATVDYQALDPLGGFSDSTVTIAVNADAVLPEGVRSELATDPPAEGTESGKCENPDDATTTTGAPVLDETTTTVTIVDESTDTTVRRTTSGSTPRRSGSTPSGRTTTTAKKSTTNPTSKPGSGGGDSPPTTNSPPVPPPENPTTTKPPSNNPPPGECGPPANTDAYKDCVKGHSTPSTTTPPSPG